MAQDFLSRSGTNSQVVSLNLTNLFILVLLKALIYAAGTLGAGAFHGHGHGHGYSFGKGRNMEENTILPQISETELLLYMGYLTGEPGHYECLHQVMCKQPELAKSYYNAANLMYNTITTFDKEAVSQQSKYQQLLNTTKEAVEFGEHGGPCEMRYPCNKPK
ncbi:uncharacterized protein LOC123291697 [Chrysoperla carnea]|uniref:uncharacterized protein LOC123291697 n=1 Tax=Chrysoperla carnea TaxID=189513 RepID=UPI001D08002C|nr:uncharacterized protein LOC123291697 [Chrysoperla carnea]